MQEEKQLSGEESLQLINRMIHEAKGYFHESGLGALVYGFTTLLCCMLTYMRSNEVIHFPFHPFYLMIPVFVVQNIIQVNEDKRKQAKTFTDEAIDFVWLGFFISALTALCAGFAGIEYLQVSIIIILAGLASFITGMLAKFRYLIVAGFICWALGIVSFFIQSPAIFLMLAAVAILIWVIPGFILLTRFKKTAACRTKSH